MKGIKNYAMSTTRYLNLVYNKNYTKNENEWNYKDKITKPMGKYIQQVYGFEVSHKDNKKLKRPSRKSKFLKRDKSWGKQRKIRIKTNK